MNIQMDKLTAYLQTMGTSARKAARTLRLADPEQRADAILAMATQVRAKQNDILTANARDMDAAREKGISPAMLDRLKLNTKRIENIATGLEAVAALPDPIGAIDEQWSRDNGLSFAKVRTPLGVIGMIYESRPNVTADAASLCIKSGNTCILRGGSEALHSNTAIHKAIVNGLKTAGLPETCVQYIETTDREAVGQMLAGLEGTIDLIIPRGGKGLVGRVQSDARVPVLAHLEGLVHTYVHKDANLEMASRVLVNAKMRRTGICGSTETLLLDEEISHYLPQIAKALTEAGCTLKGDDAARKIVKMQIASDKDYRTEYLDAIINVKIVANIEAALMHIENYGSGHTDAIITDSEHAAKKFLAEVDSAIVMHNTSTQFADGGEFGFGAEIGIATGKLHARGPVGAQHLTSYKYHVFSEGQTRP